MRANAAKKAWWTSSRTNCWTRPIIAARRSRRKKTFTAWRKPTRRLHITDGKEAASRWLLASSGKLEAFRQGLRGRKIRPKCEFRRIEDLGKCPDKHH